MFGTLKYCKDGRSNSGYLAETTKPPFDIYETGKQQSNACVNCRDKKLKCTGEKTGCRRCLVKNVNCVYNEPSLARRANNGPRRRGSSAVEAQANRRPSTSGGSSSMAASSRATTPVVASAASPDIMLDPALAAQTVPHCDMPTMDMADIDADLSTFGQLMNMADVDASGHYVRDPHLNLDLEDALSLLHSDYDTTAPLDPVAYTGGMPMPADTRPAQVSPSPIGRSSSASSGSRSSSTVGSSHGGSSSSSSSRTRSSSQSDLLTSDHGENGPRQQHSSPFESPRQRFSNGGSMDSITEGAEPCNCIWNIVKIHESLYTGRGGGAAAGGVDLSVLKTKSALACCITAVDCASCSTRSSMNAMVLSICDTILATFRRLCSPINDVGNRLGLSSLPPGTANAPYAAMSGDPGGLLPTNGYLTSHGYTLDTEDESHVIRAMISLRVQMLADVLAKIESRVIENSWASHQPALESVKASLQDTAALITSLNRAG